MTEPPRPLEPSTAIPFVPPVEVLNGHAASRWGNLGDWSQASTYPAAAHALAVRLGRAAELGPGQRIVDAGAGAGDQVGVWVEEFGVAHATVIERDARMAACVRSLARRRGWSSLVDVRAEDAAAASFDSDAFDRVVSLDAAYFFRTRARFLAAAHAALRPGGRLALADLVLRPGPAGRLARLLAPAFDVPTANLLTRPGWVASLQAMGYVDVRIDDCTGAVLGGFARWSRLSDGAGPRSRAVRVVGQVGGWVTRAHAVGYAIIRADKPVHVGGGRCGRPGGSRA